ncbi:MAG: DUF4232 domain-containing protein, partial [Actinomycetota bacterium]
TALALGGLALLATACGSSGSPAAAPTVTKTVTATPSAPGTSAGSPVPTTPTPTVSSPGQAPPCATSALSVTTGQGDGAAGSTYVPIVFTNTSGSACTLFGYPGVSFASSPGGGQVGRAAGRNNLKPSELVTLVPRAAAHATLQVVDAANFPASECKLVTVHFLKVYPPNQTVPVYLHFNAQACAGQTKSAGILNVQAVRLGSSNS